MKCVVVAIIISIIIIIIISNGWSAARSQLHRNIEMTWDLMAGAAEEGAWQPLVDEPSVQWVPREHNREPDRACNMGHLTPVESMQKKVRDELKKQGLRSP